MVGPFIYFNPGSPMTLIHPHSLKEKTNSQEALHLYSFNMDFSLA